MPTHLPWTAFSKATCKLTLKSRELGQSCSLLGLDPKRHVRAKQELKATKSREEWCEHQLVVALQKTHVWVLFSPCPQALTRYVCAIPKGPHIKPT